MTSLCFSEHPTNDVHLRENYEKKKTKIKRQKICENPPDLLLFATIGRNLVTRLIIELNRYICSYWDEVLNNEDFLSHITSPQKHQFSHTYVNLTESLRGCQS